MQAGEWVRAGSTAVINEHGDIVSKTFDGHHWTYESHIEGGPSRYGFKTAESAKAWAIKQRRGAEA